MTCKAGALLADDTPLPAEDRDTLAMELQQPAASASVLSRALANLGHRVGPTTIKDHRAARCACN